MERNKAFGRALRAVRTSRGITQEDFSQVSSRTYLSTLERGLKSPTLDKVENLASVLGIHPLSLLACTYLVPAGTESLSELFSRVEADNASIGWELDKGDVDNR